MEFSQVLRRFFAISGYPSLMLSDNGTQLVGAVSELAKMIQGWDVKKLKEYAAYKRMEWKFITPTIVPSKLRNDRFYEGHICVPRDHNSLQAAC
jgi:hypothetical protein